MSVAIAPVSKVDSLLVRPVRRRRRPAWMVWICAGWLIVVAGSGLLAPLLPIASFVTPVGPPRVPPFTEWPEFLGTDSAGRSVLSRLVYGARDSTLIGVGATAFGFAIGTTVGIVAGYFRGAADRVTSFLLEVLLAFPPLIVLLVLATILPSSLPTLIVALGIIVIPSFARLSRASTLMWADRPFVVAARTYGATDGRIIFRDLLGNVILPLLTILPIIVAALMIAEGSLSYLGFGMPPPQPSWGGMINLGAKDLRIAPALALVPAAVIFLTVFSLNIVGERIRQRYELSGGD